MIEERHIKALYNEVLKEIETGKDSSEYNYGFKTALKIVLSL